MDTTIKQGWVKNLRSGLYDQGESYLRTPDGDFCCLGVLCDMAEKAGVVQKKEGEAGMIYYGDEASGEWRSDVLPQVVMDWAGLYSNNPLVVCECRMEDCGCSENHRELAQLNDDGTTFSEIADLIDASL